MAYQSCPENLEQSKGVETLYGILSFSLLTMYQSSTYLQFPPTATYTYHHSPPLSATQTGPFIVYSCHASPSVSSTLCVLSSRPQSLVLCRSRLASAQLIQIPSANIHLVLAARILVQAPRQIARRDLAARSLLVGLLRQLLLVLQCGIGLFWCCRAAAAAAKHAPDGVADGGAYGDAAVKKGSVMGAGVQVGRNRLCMCGGTVACDCKAPKMRSIKGTRVPEHPSTEAPKAHGTIAMKLCELDTLEKSKK